MIMQPAAQLSIAFFDSVPVVVESWGARISSDAGRLPFRQLDEHLGLTRQFAARGDAHPAHTNPKRKQGRNQPEAQARPKPTRSASEAETNPKRKRGRNQPEAQARP
ncbi:MAG: hypothetical protein KJZ87_18990, partial [Thermoguttaceae bacterium]|nr:hypothetical protein [Thermoguttaceae bacterium]